VSSGPVPPVPLHYNGTEARWCDVLLIVLRIKYFQLAELSGSDCLVATWVEYSSYSHCAGPASGLLFLLPLSGARLHEMTRLTSGSTPVSMHGWNTSKYPLGRAAGYLHLQSTPKAPVKQVRDRSAMLYTFGLNNDSRPTFLPLMAAIPLCIVALSPQLQFPLEHGGISGPCVDCRQPRWTLQSSRQGESSHVGWCSVPVLTVALAKGRHDRTAAQTRSGIVRDSLIVEHEHISLLPGEERCLQPVGQRDVQNFPQGGWSLGAVIEAKSPRERLTMFSCTPNRQVVPVAPPGNTSLWGGSRGRDPEEKQTKAPKHVLARKRDTVTLQATSPPHTRKNKTFSLNEQDLSASVAPSTATFGYTYHLDQITISSVGEVCTSKFSCLHSRRTSSSSDPHWSGHYTRQQQQQ